jgi:hypothetical protein
MFNLSLSEINTVFIKGDFDLKIEFADSEYLQIDNEDCVRHQISEDKLVLSTIENSSCKGSKVSIRLKTIDELVFSGESKVFISNFIFEKLRMKADGDNFIFFSNSIVAHFQFSGNGNTVLKAHDLKAETAIINGNGTSFIEVFAADMLSLNLNGVSTITYKGNPVLKKNINGVSTITKQD